MGIYLNRFKSTLLVHGSSWCAFTHVVGIIGQSFSTNSFLQFLAQVIACRIHSSELLTLPAASPHPIA